LQFQIEGDACLDTSSPLLGQLLDNLIGNALKYSPPGSPIVVACARQEGRVAFSVSDQGVGIAPDELTEIFKPFYRAERARLSGAAGTGLGLPIAQRLAVALGGELACYSQVGRGTTFSFSLPARAGATSPPTTGCASKESRPPYFVPAADVRKA
jgi:signal transduction histidine kinase